MELIFEKSVHGRIAFRFPGSDVPASKGIPEAFRRVKPCELPEVSEPEIVRHFTCLSRMNFSVDTNFYPLGSCTMKYNPKFTEAVAALDGFSHLHPLMPQIRLGGLLTQGALEVLYNMERILSEITGMDSFTMQPAAGAHGELTGVMLIAAYHRAKKNKKTHVIIPDSAHGTNPASAAIAGYDVVTVPSDKNGVIDLAVIKERLNEETAAVMLTCPNTVGIFNSDIDTVTKLAHEKDALVYYDGANLNAVMGKARPGDLGFDVVHLNLHKTFATPHGGGGPGAGPVGVKKELARFLPISRVMKREDGTYYLKYNEPDTIGYIASFYGNFLVILKAYAYILFMGRDGLIEASEHAVLNANYLLARLKKYYYLPYDRGCMHECVFSASRQAERGVRALDIAKFLIDNGIHPPTVYFPLSVKEAMMIEPTETESKRTLDRFADIMIAAAKKAESDPEGFHDMPVSMPVYRLDEVKAARELDCNYKG